MAFDPKALLFAVVVVAAAASYGLSSYFYTKMIREVRKADGPLGSSPWPLILRGGWYLMIRHEQVCPDGESTRALYFLLGLVGFGLAICAVTLWSG
jgi:drug/metabolite transporter (DMT)-like permease